MSMEPKLRSVTNGWLMVELRDSRRGSIWGAHCQLLWLVRHLEEAAWTLVRSVLECRSPSQSHEDADANAHARQINHKSHLPPYLPCYRYNKNSQLQKNLQHINLEFNNSQISTEVVTRVCFQFDFKRKCFVHTNNTSTYYKILKLISTKFMSNGEKKIIHFDFCIYTSK